MDESIILGSDSHTTLSCPPVTKEGNSLMSKTHVILSVTLSALLLAPAFAGDRAGLARSEGGFDIVRAETPVSARVGTLNAVEVGDRLVADQSMVNLTRTNGDNLVLGVGSDVSFPSAETTVINTGAVAAASEEGMRGTIVFGDLAVTAIDPAASQIVALTTDEAGNMLVEVLQGGVNLRNTALDTQVAVVSPGDNLVFVPDATADSGYRIVARDAGQGRGNAGSQRQFVGQFSPDDSDEAAGFFAGAGTPALIAGGILGAGLLGAGGYLLYDEGYRERIRDDDEDDDDRGDGSTIIPTRSGGNTGEAPQ